MTFRIAAAALLAILPGAALAQTADVASITCADLATMDADGVTALLFWVDGYLGGQAGDTGFDLERLQANIDGAGAACANDPSLSVLDAVAQAENGG
jgi:hypothetical protein